MERVPSSRQDASFVETAFASSHPQWSADNVETYPKAAEWAVLAVLIMSAAVLRMQDLGGLGFYADEETTALAVQGILQDGDSVIAMDALQQRYYVGRVDYWLRELSDAKPYSYRRQEHYYDIYTDSRVIPTRMELEEKVSADAPGVAWVITSGELTGRQAMFVPQGVEDWLSSRGTLVFTGRDKSHPGVLLSAGSNNV